MALYKYPVLLRQSKNPVFDAPSAPSTVAQCGGIYRCTGCGTEIAVDPREILPGTGHHSHKSPLIPVQWQLIVATAAGAPVAASSVRPEEGRS